MQQRLPSLIGDPIAFAHRGAKAHAQGWRYRGYYPEQERITSVLDELELKRSGLPVFRASVLHDPQLARALQALPDYYSALRDVSAEKRADFVLEGKRGASGLHDDLCTEAPTDAT